MSIESILRGLRQLIPRLPEPRYKYSARMAIARDVLLRLQLGTLRGRNNGYFNLLRGSTENKDSFEAFAISGKLPNTFSQCSACAIGAACLAAVGLYDKAPEAETDWGSKYASNSDRTVSSTAMREVLHRWFSKAQLDQIENAFECRVGYNDSDELDLTARRRASSFGRKFDYAQERMIAIFQNIIDNRGEFRV